MDYFFSDNAKLQKVLDKSRYITRLSGISAFLEWDQEVLMPRSAAVVRGEQMALLSELLHTSLVDQKFGEHLYKLKSEMETNPDTFTVADHALVQEYILRYEREAKLPTHFVKEYTKHTAKSLESWKEARHKSDFSMFATDLTLMVDLNVKKAQYLGFKVSPYDALLDSYESGLTEAKLSALFSPLKTFTANYLSKVMTKKKDIAPLPSTVFPIAKQIEFNRQLAKGLNFDFDCGRMDVSTHPFTSEFGTIKDVRITTRYDERNIIPAIMATIHEVGHALYAQGISATLDSTFLATGLSFGIHESQSRLWENFIGRSEDFWAYWFPQLQSYFPESLSPSDESGFVQSLNTVTPSLIRVDADELTYNLHIILRFEVERLLISGKLKVSEVPEFWNTTIKDYLNITPPNDAQGCLQDIHWAMGGFGYFPTYTLGNIYAAQFYNTLKASIPNLSAEVRSGNYSSILNFLRDKIHVHGCVYSPDKLCTMVTGEELKPEYLNNYLTNKFDSIYNL